MKILLPLAAIAIGAATATLSASPAFAEPSAAATTTVVVRHVDLNLNSEAGVTALDRRIRAAVKAACGTASDFDLRGKNKVRKCRADTLASVAAQRNKAIALAQRASQIRLAAQ